MILVLAAAILGTGDLGDPTRASKRICPEAHASKAPMELKRNEEKLTVRELLSLSAAEIDVVERTGDWNRKQAQAALRAALKARPRELTSKPAWAEGENTTTRTAIGVIGKTRVRVHLANYHVCVREASGKHWFYRTVDNWR